MRLIFLVVLASLVFIPLLGNSLQYTKINPNEINLNFQLPDYSTQSELTNGKQVRKLKVSAPSEENWQDNFSGMPQLVQWVYIPDGYDAQVTLNDTDIETKEDYQCDAEKTDNDVQDWLDVSQPIVFRGNRILSICIKPFRYESQSKQLETLAQADIRVRFVSSNDATDNSRYYTPTTVEMLKAICINREDIRTTNQSPGSYIIFYNGTSLTSVIQPLADWKHQKGFEVHMVETSTIGNNTDDIKGYLQTAYNTWTHPPEYILMLGKPTGNVNPVPTYNEFYHYNTHGDYRYTLLDGSDLVPDAYIGRLTFASSTELQTAINKILQYEKFSGLSTATPNWLNSSFLLGDVYQSGESCRTTITYVKELLQDYNPGVQITETYSGSFPNQITAALFSGVGTYWYRGHGEFSGWTNTNCENLQNNGKYPFISYVTCFTGNFGNNTSLISPAEKFMRVGTPSSPRGAIGVIGASCETHTCLNNILTGGFAFGLYNEGITQCGPTLVRGKLALMANYPQNPANYLNQNFQSFNLFGDPSLDIWLKPVTNIVVTASPELFSNGGNASFRVTLADDTPVEGAWVCLTKGTDELFVSGYTDANGILVLTYNALTTGTVKLTVTKSQHKPYITNITVNMSNPTLSMSSISALNQCYAGSTLSFPISVTNNSASTLSNVIGTLQTLNGDVSIPMNQNSFGNILAGAIAVSQSNYQIEIDSEISKGETIYLNLHLTYDGGSFDIPISCVENGPDLSISDAHFGNNDVLSLGTDSLTISIINNSQVNATNLEAILESTNPLVTIQNPGQTLGNVSVNATVLIPEDYIILVSDSLMEGMNVRFNLRLFNSDGFVQTLYLDKKIGIASTNDITGPDSYGYVCYGPGDSGNFPYAWVETDPALGGFGTNLNLSDLDTEGSGDYATITVPFQFRFYGRAYTQITICSNGFIMPGNRGSIEWMNWGIPGPMVPRPIIAPFWDDLLTDNQSKILYQYDANLHAMIIQWQDLVNKYSPTNRETFQAILFDPFYRTSPTGDSPLLFLYNVFNNVDGGSYGLDYIDHGQYATIGIADHTGLRGLEYTFNNQYPPTAQILTNLSSLYFTTLPSYQVEPNPVLLNCQLNELTGNGNSQVDAGEQFSLNMLIKNTGLGALTESQVTLSSTDPFVSIVQNQANLQTLFSTQTASSSPDFRISISSNCPNLHNLNFNLHIQNQQDQFDIPYALVVHALQINYDNVVITDANNNFPEPGETVQITFNLNNVSMLPAQGLVVALNPPNGVTVFPATQTIDIPAMSTYEVSFQVTLDNTVSQGDAIELGLHTSIAGVYDSLLIIPILVGVPDIVLNTGFEEPDIGTVIPFMYNANVVPSQYIHDSGHEAVMHVEPNDPWSYIFTNQITTQDLQIARVNFSWFNTDSSANISLKVLYSNQPTMLTIWNSTMMTTNPQNTTVDLTDIPPDAEYVIFVFAGNLTGVTTSSIAIDDVSILTVHHAPGFIAGHVTLDLYQENVAQVNLVERFSNTIYHPDANGDFLFPAYQGQCIVYAYLENYYNPDDSLQVTVVSGQTSYNNQINLEKMRAPVNLQYTMTGNVINLSWNLEGQDVTTRGTKADKKKDRFHLPDYYRIYFRYNSFNFQATSDAQTYSRELNMNGNYQIYVCAMYLMDGGEVQTDSSNTISFFYTPDEDNLDIPIVLTLNQNCPNPFNPKTQISFSLPENSRTKLNIYNLKGQLVKTLIDTEYKKGNHTIVWDGFDNNHVPVSSGIYYYKLNWKDKEITRKMVMLK